MSFPFGRAARCLFLLLLITGIVTGSAKAQRLPKDVVPEHYKLFLDPDIAGRTFSGKETIRVRILHPTSEITLNSLGLEISLAAVIAAGRTQQAKVIVDQPDEMVRLALDTPVPEGSAELHLKFSGQLTEGLRG